ncbi:hypothetical protein GUJ93_ZPchr0011g26991 [Zizania palustris]|uniref:Uncharacterized protein n=1 Tax=Zizania palustris TaxID=103762 RepID=A0A8J6BP35_ZIZPA|nr:hypothetical protein GUJ93_ZPchr0011g26991 [Zizania palustris]
MTARAWRVAAVGRSCTVVALWETETTRADGMGRVRRQAGSLRRGLPPSPLRCSSLLPPRYAALRLCRPRRLEPPILPPPELRFICTIASLPLLRDNIWGKATRDARIEFFLYCPVCLVAEIGR